MKEKIKVKNDFIFKRIFGDQDNSEILKSFLEAILHEKIEKIEMMKDARLGQEHMDDKLGILDIKAEFNNNIKVNIEIQLINQYNMIKRTLFYWSK